MILLLVSIIVTIVFIAAFRISDLLTSVSSITAKLRETVQVMRDSAISDDQKERSVQQASLYLFRAVGFMTVRVLFIMITPVSIIYLADWLGLATVPDIYEFMLTWEFIIASSLAAIAILWRWR